MLKCDFNKITFQHGFFPVNLLNFSEHLFIRTLLEGCSQIKYFIKKYQPYFTNSQILLWMWQIWKHSLQINFEHLSQKFDVFLSLYFFDLFFSLPHFTYLPLLGYWLTGKCFPLSLTNSLDWHWADTLSFSL